MRASVFFHENNRWLDPVFFFLDQWSVRIARATFHCAGAKIFFVFSTFDDHAVLCAVKSDK